MIILYKQTTDFEEGCSWLMSKKVRDYALANWTNYSLCYSLSKNEQGEQTFICQVPESIEDRENLFELDNVHYMS